MATISMQHGLKIGITKIREIAGTDKTGTNVYGIIKVAEHFGEQEEIVKLYPEVEVKVYPSRGLCAYYGERGGLLVGCEI